MINNINYKHCSINQFINKIKANNLIGFGVSSLLNKIVLENEDVAAAILSEMVAIAENNITMHGSFFIYKDKQIPIISPDKINSFSDAVILINTLMHESTLDIANQLNKIDFKSKIDCYSLFLLINNPIEAIDNSAAENIIYLDIPYKIPKKIHSFWFSGDDKPIHYMKCIESWREKCPEFEIIEWNLENYDITKSEYMLQAYEKRKWAFISDFARLDVVYSYGGIYMDMDVELLRPIDNFLKINNFFCKDDKGFIDLGSGFGAVKESNVIKKLLDAYNNKKFILENGEINTETQPYYLLPIFKDLGVSSSKSSELINDEILFLSNDYFKVVMGDGTKQKWTGKEVAMHWHKGGWVDKDKHKLWVKERGYLAELLNLFRELGED